MKEILVKYLLLGEQRWARKSRRKSWKNKITSEKKLIFLNV